MLGEGSDTYIICHITHNGRGQIEEESLKVNHGILLCSFGKQSSNS